MRSDIKAEPLVIQNFWGVKVTVNVVSHQTKIYKMAKFMIIWKILGLIILLFTTVVSIFSPFIVNGLSCLSEKNSNEAHLGLIFSNSTNVMSTIGDISSKAVYADW